MLIHLLWQILKIQKLKQLSDKHLSSFNLDLAGHIVSHLLLLFLSLSIFYFILSVEINSSSQIFLSGSLILLLFYLRKKSWILCIYVIHRQISSMFYNYLIWFLKEASSEWPHIVMAFQSFYSKEAHLKKNKKLKYNWHGSMHIKLYNLVNLKVWTCLHCETVTIIKTANIYIILQASFPSLIFPLCPLFAFVSHPQATTDLFVTRD